MHLLGYENVRNKFIQANSSKTLAKQVQYVRYTSTSTYIAVWKSMLLFDTNKFIFQRVSDQDKYIFAALPTFKI